MSLETYRNRLLAQGNSSKEVVANNTKNMINNTFKNSFLSTNVLINGISTEVIINSTDKSDEKLLLYKPDEFFNIGSIVDVNGKNYLIVESDDLNTVYPTSRIKLCNSTFPLPGETTRTQTGTNSFGEPIFSETTTEPTLLPCIAETTVTSDNSDEAINLPEGQIQITVSYTEHEAIGEGRNFTMYNTQYETIGIDRTKSINGVGLLVIKGKKV